MVSKIPNNSFLLYQPKLALEKNFCSSIEKIGKKNMLVVAAFFSLGCFTGSFYGFYVGLGATVSLIAVYAIYKKCKKTPADTSVIKKDFPRIETLNLSDQKIDPSHLKDKISRPDPVEPMNKITNSEVLTFFRSEENLKYYVPETKVKGRSLTQHEKHQLRADRQEQLKKLIGHLSERVYEKNMRSRKSVVNEKTWNYLRHIVHALKKQQNNGDLKDYEKQMSTCFETLPYMKNRCADQTFSLIEKLFHSIVRSGKAFAENMSFPNLVKRELCNYRLGIFDQAINSIPKEADEHQANTYRKQRDLAGEKHGLPKMELCDEKTAPCAEKNAVYVQGIVDESFKVHYTKEKIADHLIGKIYAPGKKQERDLSWKKYDEWLDLYYNVTTEQKGSLLDESDLLNRKAMVLLLNHIGVFKKKEE